ncbi:MAG TPA: type IV toxin-antitoxin system AbiEi family antitoxin [Thermoleophilaceae bacterium]|nr:type IV toxin-antitoxin system AbiEi family antitoxin [Thermoleophilaceae bacterium]
MERQHGVIARAQLLELGLRSDSIAHRVGAGRLHPVAQGIYAAGRPDLSRNGRWFAALLSCGPSAVLSHRSAAALWGVHPNDLASTEVTVATTVRRRRPGVVVHCRVLEADERTSRDGVPVTTVERTLLDLATRVSGTVLERAINEADKLDLVDPDALRAALDRYSGRPGVAALRTILDRHAFRLTDSELERRFLALVRRSGLSLPDTGTRLNGFRVDFHWPGLGLVVETDGLRYHCTAAQQMRDRLRDQAHTAAGLTALRFTHFQVRYEPRYVQATLITVARRLDQRPDEGSLCS